MTGESIVTGSSIHVHGVGEPCNSKCIVAPQPPQDGLAGPVGYDRTGRCLHCGRGALRPFWRQWWFWLIAYLIFCLVLVNLTT